MSDKLTMEELVERVFDLAEAHDGRYLLERHEYAEKGDEFMACDALVTDGCAIWDRNSRYFPCIRLTGKPLPAGRIALSGTKQ